MGPRTLHLPNCQRVLFLKCKSNQVFPAYNPSISREPNWNFLAWHIISFIICLLASSSVIPQELLYVLITQLAIFKILSALKCSTLSWDSLTINCLHKWFLHVWQDPLRLSPPPPWCLPPSHHPYPTPLGGHKALNWSPCVMQLLPTSYLFYVW